MRKRYTHALGVCARGNKGGGPLLERCTRDIRVTFNPQDSDSRRSQNQSVGSGMSMRLKKVCPQCSAVLHARKLACHCGHVFRAKPQQNERKRLIESRETDNVHKAAKRACETQEEALNRQAQNAEHMASVRESETRGKSVKRLAQCKQVLEHVEQVKRS